jgi:hypothetical protein
VREGSRWRRSLPLLLLDPSPDFKCWKTLTRGIFRCDNTFIKNHLSRYSFLESELQKRKRHKTHKKISDSAGPMVRSSSMRDA